MKVKILEATTAPELETKVNDYLKTVDSKFHEFLYQHVTNSGLSGFGSSEKYSVMIVTH